MQEPFEILFIIAANRIFVNGCGFFGGRVLLGCFEKMLKVLRDGGREVVVFAEKVEFKAFRVQKMSGGRWYQQLIGFAGKFGAIEFVADYRVSDASEMDADLVHAAGFRLRFDEIEVFGTLNNGIMRDSVADFPFGLEFVVHDDLLVQSERSSDRLRYDAFLRLYMAINDSRIGFLYRTLLEHSLEFHECFLRFGGDTDAGSVLVEAMNHSGTKPIFTDFDNFRTLGDEPVGDGIGILDSGRVHSDAGRFVEDNERFVLEKDFYRQIGVCWHEFFFRFGDIDKCQNITGLECVAWFRFDSIDKHEPFLYHHGTFVTAGNRVARQRRLFHEKMIESLIGFVGFDDVIEKHIEVK